MKQVILLYTTLACVYALDDLSVDDVLSMYNVTGSNWTTCDTFVANSLFDPNSVLDVDWKIFYFWNFDYEESYILRFSKPTTMLLDRFMTIVDKDVNKTINWNDAELFVESSVDLSGILIRTQAPGRFHFVPAPHIEFQSTPSSLFALKLVDGYLGIMNCQRHIAYALAPVDRMPGSDQLEDAVSKINFWNPFGRSYLVQMNNTSAGNIKGSQGDELDDDDVVEMEIEKANEAFEMF